MTNKEAIEELKGMQDFINGTRLKGEIRAEVFDLAIKALEERPQGEWIDTGSGQECNVCHEVQYGYDNFRYYCARCGAQMQKGGAE